MRGWFLIPIMAALLAAVDGSAATTGGPVRRLVLGEQRIEGKIRRPQLVLIKADQRPSFGPIVVQSVSSDANIAGSVSPAAIEKSPYDGPFRFNGKRIVNYVP